MRQPQGSIIAVTLLTYGRHHPGHSRPHFLDDGEAVRARTAEPPHQRLQHGYQVVESPSVDGAPPGAGSTPSCPDTVAKSQ